MEICSHHLVVHARARAGDGAAAAEARDALVLLEGLAEAPVLLYEGHAVHRGGVLGGAALDGADEPRLGGVQLGGGAERRSEHGDADDADAGEVDADSAPGDGHGGHRVADAGHEVVGSEEPGDEGPLALELKRVEADGAGGP